MASTVRGPPPPPPANGHIPLPSGPASPAIAPPPPDPDQETDISYASISAEEQEVFYRKYGMYKQWARQVADDGAFRMPESRPGRDVGAGSAIWDSVTMLRTEPSGEFERPDKHGPQTRVSSAGRYLVDDGSARGASKEKVPVPIKSPLADATGSPPEPVLARPPTSKPSRLVSDKAIPPAPGDLLTPAPLPGSTRAARDAYLASATYLPLEMLSEVEAPRPQSSDSSPLSSGRLASLLSLRIKSPNVSVSGKSAATTIKAGKTPRSTSDPVKPAVVKTTAHKGKPPHGTRGAPASRGRFAESALSPRLLPLPPTGGGSLSYDVPPLNPSLNPSLNADPSNMLLPPLSLPPLGKGIEVESNNSARKPLGALGLTVDPPIEQKFPVSHREPRPEALGGTTADPHSQQNLNGPSSPHPSTAHQPRPPGLNQGVSDSQPVARENPRSHGSTKPNIQPRDSAPRSNGEFHVTGESEARSLGSQGSRISRQDVTQGKSLESLSGTPGGAANSAPRKLASGTSARLRKDPHNVPLPPSTAAEQAVRSLGSSTSQRPSQYQLTADMTPLAAMSSQSWKDPPSVPLPPSSAVEQTVTSLEPSTLQPLSPQPEANMAPLVGSGRSRQPSVIPGQVPLPPTAGTGERADISRPQGFPPGSKPSQTTAIPSRRQLPAVPDNPVSETAHHDHASTHRQQLPLPRPALSMAMSGLSGAGKTLGRRHRDPSSANLTAHFEPATYPLPPSGSESETMVVSPPKTDKSVTLVLPPTPVGLVHSTVVVPDVGKPNSHSAGGPPVPSTRSNTRDANARSVATAADRDFGHNQPRSMSDAPSDVGVVSHAQERTQPHRGASSPENIPSLSDPPSTGASHRKPVVDLASPQHPAIIIPAPLGLENSPETDHVSFEVPSGNRGRLRVSLAWFRDGTRTERRTRSRADRSNIDPLVPPPVPPKSPRSISSRLRDNASPRTRVRQENDLHPSFSSHPSSHPSRGDHTSAPHRGLANPDEGWTHDRDTRDRLSPLAADAPAYGWPTSPLMPYAPPHPFHTQFPGVNSLAYPQPPVRPAMFGAWPMAGPMVPPGVPLPFAPSQATPSRAPPSPPRPPSIEPPSSRGSPLRPLPGLPYAPGPPGLPYRTANPPLGLHGPWGMGMQPPGGRQRTGIWSQFFGGRRAQGEGPDPGEDAEIKRWRTGVPPQHPPPPARTHAPTLARTLFTSRDKQHLEQSGSRWNGLLPRRTRGGMYDRRPRTPPAPLPPLPSVPVVGRRPANTGRNPFRTRRPDVSFFDQGAADRQREKEERRRAKVDRRNRREAQSRDTSRDTPRESRERGGRGGFGPWASLGFGRDDAADGRKKGFMLRGNGREGQPNTGPLHAQTRGPGPRGRSGDVVRGWVESIRPFARKGQGQGQDGRPDRPSGGPFRRDVRTVQGARKDPARGDALRGRTDADGLGRKLSSRKWSDRARDMSRR